MNINTFVALIALYDLKAKEFKPLFNMYLKSINRFNYNDNVLLFLLLKEVANDDNF